MIKPVIAIFGAAALLCACQPKGYVIDGTLANAEGAKVVLVKRMPTEEVRVDSTVVRDGKFRLEGRVESPDLYMLEVNLNPEGTSMEEMDYDKMFKADFYLENSPVTFEADLNTMASYFWNPERKTVDPVIRGSREQALCEQLDASRSEVKRELDSLSKRMVDEYYRPAAEGEKVAVETAIEIAEAEMKTVERYRSQTLDFVRANPGAAVSFDEVSYLFGSGSVSPFTADQIDEYMALLEPAWKGTAKYAWLSEQAAKAKKLAVGEKFIDCEFYNLAGEKVKLSSVIPEGKFAMLEFWASWCGPCRGEIPHLKHVREVYPDFDIISVSVDDKDADWQQAVREEGMDWVQLRDEGFVNGKAMELYGVVGVPCCIILDKEGRFYKTNMRGAYLDAFLKELYGR